MPADTIEEWVPVVRLDGHYEVSNLGRVRHATKGRLPRKLRASRYGYLRFNAVIGGRHITCNVHLLVADAFLPPKPGLSFEINHRDGVKTNNRADNLEWVTSSQNRLHALRLGLLPNIKLTERQVRAIRKLSREFSAREIGEVLGIATTTVASARNGQKWRHVT